MCLNWAVKLLPRILVTVRMLPKLRIIRRVSLLGTSTPFQSNLLLLFKFVSK